jgi:hypothetical protein
LQFADQGWLLRDAFIMVNSNPAPTPQALLEFVNSHKAGTLPAAWGRRLGGAEVWLPGPADLAS